MRALCVALALATAADHRPRRDLLRGRDREDRDVLADVDDADLDRDDDRFKAEEDDVDEPDAYPDDPPHRKSRDDLSLQEQVAKLASRLDDAAVTTKRVEQLETEVGELETELAEERSEAAHAEGSVLAKVSKSLKPVVHKLVTAVAKVVQREQGLEAKVATAQQGAAKATAVANAAAAQAAKASSMEAATYSVALGAKGAKRAKGGPELEAEVEKEVQKALAAELDREARALNQSHFASAVAEEVERNVSARLRRRPVPRATPGPKHALAFEQVAASTATLHPKQEAPEAPETPLSRLASSDDGLDAAVDAVAAALLPPQDQVAQAETKAEPKAEPQAEPQAEPAGVAEQASRAAPRPRPVTAAPKALVQQPPVDAHADFSGAFCSMCGSRCPYAICH